jgi:hypothetical protein
MDDEDVQALISPTAPQLEKKPLHFPSILSAIRNAHPNPNRRTVVTSIDPNPPVVPVLA